MSPELDAAIAAAEAAGRIQRRRYRRLHTIMTKADDTPVTATDRDSEAAIRRVLARAFPEYGFLGEESTEGNPSAPIAGASPRWIVDPLDGTKKYVRGLPFFGPCVALERGGDVALGVMRLPACRETLWAEQGHGAFLNGEPIAVSTQDQLERAYVVWDNERAFLERGWSKTLERLVTTAYHNPGFLDLYSYAQLAAGRIDAVVMIGEAPWDIAAARVIVEEAGGRFTDFDGTRSIYNGTTVASNGRIHDQLLALLAGRP